MLKFLSFLITIVTTSFKEYFIYFYFEMLNVAKFFHLSQDVYKLFLDIILSPYGKTTLPTQMSAANESIG